MVLGVISFSGEYCDGLWVTLVQIVTVLSESKRKMFVVSSVSVITRRWGSYST